MTETVFNLDDPEVPVRLRVIPRARRFTLRVEPDGGGAVLTLPPGVPMAEARMFLMRQSDWLTRALARHPGRVAVGAGTLLPVAGREVEVALGTGPRRPPLLADGRLTLSGPGAPGPRIAAWLKLRARDALVPATQRYAGMLGREVRGVSLRDTRSRWGSCTSAGRLAFSWRLAMAPPEVLDYVAAHEAAHLVEMSHAPRFWATVEKLMPDYRPRRAWLKREGRGLHRYGFTGE
jgi:predicted metal-dependent hydrolase